MAGPKQRKKLTGVELARKRQPTGRLLADVLRKSKKDSETRAAKDKKLRDRAKREKNRQIRKQDIGPKFIFSKVRDKQRIKKKP